MARTYATVGPMMSYAYDKVLDEGATEHRSERPDRAELFLELLRHMIEFAAMSPSSRRAFLSVIAGVSSPSGSLLVVPGGEGPDLEARLVAPEDDDDTEDAAVVAVALTTDAGAAAAAIPELLTGLGDSPRSRLVLIGRSVDRLGYSGPDADRVIEASWERIARKLSKKDSGHAELWRTIGDIGRTAGRPVVQLPVNPRKLLTSSETAQELQDHLEVLHRSCRTLLGISPRFSTLSSLREARLQAGDSRGRAGLQFGEVEDGVPLHVVRSGEFVSTLPLGAPRNEEEQAEADALLETIAARPSWRTTPRRLPELPDLIGAPASPEMDSARRILWALLNPVLLREMGFEPAPSRTQPVVSGGGLALRLVTADDPDGPVYRIHVGRRKRWRSLTPRVTREATEDLPRESYAVPPQKNQSTSEFVWEVHRALRSLTIAPRRATRGSRKGSVR